MTEPTSPNEPTSPPPRRPLLVAEAPPEPPPEAEPPRPAPRAVEVDPEAGMRPPPWAKIPGEDGNPPWPKGRGFPPDVGLWFVALPVEWMRRRTANGDPLGEPVELVPGAPMIRCRQVILWELSIGDEMIAFQRAMGDQNRAQHELAKMMIRAIDGAPADWSKPTAAASVERFWEDVGPRVRDLLVRLYVSIHHLGEKERSDFFVSCVALRRAVY